MIFFDLDGTLTDHSGASRAAAMWLWNSNSVRWNLDFDTFVETWNGIIARHLKQSVSCCFLPGGVSCLTELADLTGAGASDEQTDLFAKYMRIYIAETAAYDDAFSCLDHFADEPLGIISNGDRVLQREKLERSGLSARFVHIIVSEDVGQAKPEPAIFQHACDTARVRSEDCIYVGDNYRADVIGARNAGWKVIWVKRASQVVPIIPLAASIKPLEHVAIVSSLAEVPQIIAAWRGVAVPQAQPLSHHTQSPLPIGS